jgi:hypothetical protein
MPSYMYFLVLILAASTISPVLAVGGETQSEPIPPYATLHLG